MQYALRMEDSNDYGKATVSKLALGWQVNGSSQVQIFEQ